jgi:hypothetical protein
MEPNYLLRMVYDGDPTESLDTRGPIELTKAIPFDTGESSISTPITTFLKKAESGLLSKSVAVDPTWFQPIGRVVEKSEDLPEKSQQRLAKFCTAFQKLFPGHNPEQLEQARTIAKGALIQARREILAA